MIGFIVGSMLGGTIGMTAMCLMQAAGRADEMEERYLREEKKRREELFSEKK